MELKIITGVGASTGLRNLKSRMSGTVVELESEARDRVSFVAIFDVPPQDVKSHEVQRIIQEAQRQKEYAKKLRESVKAAGRFFWPFKYFALRRLNGRFKRLVEELRVPPCGRRPSFCPAYLSSIADTIVELIRANAKLLELRKFQHFNFARNSRWPVVIYALGSGATSVTLASLLVDRLTRLVAEMPIITPVLFLALPHPAEIVEREPHMREVLRQVFKQSLSLLTRGVPTFVTLNGYYVQSEESLWSAGQEDVTHSTALWCNHASEPPLGEPRFEDFDNMMAEAVKFAINYFLKAGDNVGREFLYEAQQGRVFVLGGPLELSFEGPFVPTMLFPVKLLRRDTDYTRCGVWGIAGDLEILNSVGGVGEATYVKVVEGEGLQLWGVVKTTPTNLLATYRAYLEKSGVQENWGVAVKS